ncbi:dNTP triphosphohydrolase [Myxococcus sp. MISCRS1]|nr:MULTISPECIES: dNTP triphosphohydrolase [Myxococcus]MCK8502787.1 dNTP triphosphohydrolase [Myxococcus fulvus]MCY1002101.1 dNTP triphosphohydrolase [Myxococcus sp. MISCRS1]BDT36326.1 dNTP triphosphohydrolase [Myxococcus sp. MH1]
MSGHRVGSEPKPVEARVEKAPAGEVSLPLDERTPFDVDYDRIVFSSEFRCLHDKTQVFPLSTSDYTRTRLTHSIEASCVGRSLGQLAGLGLKSQGVKVEPSHLGTIVAAACLAHDIGNPPFGHSGEAAIQHWVSQRLAKPGETLAGKPSPFTKAEEWRDLESFEGNAQGFRILNRLQSRERRGGLRYTAATLGAMSKYPRPSVLPGGREANKARVSEKKFGYFQDDHVLALETYRAAGLPEREEGVFSRHPLAFLVEAADDICYAVIDLEDSAKLGLVPMDVACELLDQVLPPPEKSTRLPPAHLETRLAQARARVIGVLIQASVRVFLEHVEQMEEGEWEKPLVSAREDIRGPLDAIKKLTRRKGYESERVLQIESAGFKTLGGLLDMFAQAVVTDTPNREEKKLRQLLPLELFQRPDKPLTSEDIGDALARLSMYQRLLCVTDYISGMTDGFAVALYQRLSGIKLPT